MSRLWRDQIEVFFAPERVDLVRSTRDFRSVLREPRGLRNLRNLRDLWRPVQTSKITAWCQRNAISDQTDWETPLHQLEQMLKETAGTEVMITLSNHFIRYVALPPQAEITTPDEVYAYATFRMRDIYAARVNDWSLSVSAWDPAAGAVCAALDRDLLARFEDLAARYGIKLKGVEPYLASALDRWQQQLTGERVCFALIETGRFCIALLAKGHWQSIRNQRLLQSVEDELLAALDQEVILSGHKKTVEQVHLFAPTHPGVALPDDCGWCIVPIQTGQIPAPAHYPIASVDSEEMNACIV